MTQQGSMGGQWAKQQQDALKRQEKRAAQTEARRVVEGGEADQESQQEQKSQGQPRDDHRSDK